MGKTVRLVPLTDLTLVRVTCQNCATAAPGSRAVVEVPLERLDRAYADGTCPVCGESFDPLRKGVNHLTWLRDVLLAIKDHSNAFTVEFVLPVNEPPA